MLCFCSHRLHRYRRRQWEVMRSVLSVCLLVCLFPVYLLNQLTLIVTCVWIMTAACQGLKVKNIGQGYICRRKYVCCATVFSAILSVRIDGRSSTNIKFIKNNQKVLYFWRRFDLCQRPSSEEAGTRSSSSGSWRDKLLSSQESGRTYDWVGSSLRHGSWIVDLPSGYELPPWSIW